MTALEPCTASAASWSLETAQPAASCYVSAVMPCEVQWFQTSLPGLLVCRHWMALLFSVASLAWRSAASGSVCAGLWCRPVQLLVVGIHSRALSSWWSSCSRLEWSIGCRWWLNLCWNRRSVEPGTRRSWWKLDRCWRTLLWCESVPFRLQLPFLEPRHSLRHFWTSTLQIKDQTESKTLCWA